MHIRKHIIILLICLILVSIGFKFYTQARISAKMATTVSRLANIRGALLNYKNEHGNFPKSLADLNLDSITIRDPFTEDTFTYVVAQEPPIRLSIVQQPISFRTALWPWGEIRQYGLFADGEIKNII